MTKRALIENNTNRVVQIVQTEADQFEVHGGLYWMDCPDNTESYFLLKDDGSFEVVSVKLSRGIDIRCKLLVRSILFFGVSAGVAA